MKKPTAASLALVLAVAACTSVQANRFSAADRYAPVTVEEVHVFTADEDEPRCYDLLAELQGSGSMFNDREALVEHFREKAAEVGANGVLLRGYDDSSWGVQEKEATALAIRYGDAACDEEG